MHRPCRTDEPPRRRSRRRADAPRAVRGRLILSRGAVSASTIRDRSIEPSLIVALDGWVDAGSAATTAAGPDRRRRPRRRDLRRRPALRLPGPPADPRDRRRPARRARLAGVPDPARPHRRPRPARPDRPRAGLPLAEPGRGGRRGGAAARRREWISIGAIPAAVPHTRAGADPRDGVAPGAAPRRHPARPVRAAPRPGRARQRPRDAGRRPTGSITVGYFAQVPHYVSGPYPPAALELLVAVERHLGLSSSIAASSSTSPSSSGPASTRRRRSTTTRGGYVERLEAMVDEERLPAGDDLITRDRAVPPGPGERSGPRDAPRGAA